MQSKTAAKGLAPGSGAYSEIEDLIALRHAAKGLKLSIQRRALSALAGPNRANFRGRGIDFEEVRLYQPGDDIRSIDWRVTARSGKPHTKLFREERERPTLLMIDQRVSMFFGSQCCFKSVLAARLGALLAWAALSNGDRVGGLVFNDHQHLEVRPRRSRNAVLQLINQSHHYNHLLKKEQLDADIKLKLNDIAADLLRIAKPGSAIFFISDLKGFDEETEKLFFHISRHNDMTVLFPYDELENKLPARGYYNFSNGQRRFRLFTGDKQLRQRYEQHFSDRYQHLQDRLGRQGIALIPVATHDSPLATLQRYFGRR